MPRLTLLILIIMALCSPGQAAETMIISGHPNYPPYMWNQGKELQGVGAKLAIAICEKLKIDYRLTPIDSWQRVQEMARHGHIDMLIGAYDNEVRRAYMDFSIPYLQDPTNIFIHKKFPFPYKSREDLVDKKGVAMFGESFGQQLDEFINDALAVNRVYTAEALFANLQNQRADYIIWGYYPWHDNAQKFQAKEWCIPLPQPITEQGMHLTFSKKSQFLKLLPQVNQIIRQLQQNGTLEQWRQSYTNTNLPHPASK